MKKIVVFLSVLLLVSCNDTGVEKPEHLIEKDEMIAILYDITLLQASENVNAAKLKEEGVKANDFIYKKYNIDSLIFAQNNRYYASRPATYKKMFGEVYNRIELKQQEMADKTGKASAPSDTPAIQ
ncbi:MAG: DUF4296 domain-containing protein [Flavobacterium sp.]|nr:DUF4296 domain-containing protein [Flavobacterium sp.]